MASPGFLMAGHVASYPSPLTLTLVDSQGAWGVSPLAKVAQREILISSTPKARKMNE